MLNLFQRLMNKLFDTQYVGVATNNGSFKATRAQRISDGSWVIQVQGGNWRVLNLIASRVEVAGESHWGNHWMPLTDFIMAMQAMALSSIAAEQRPETYPNEAAEVP